MPKRRQPYGRRADSCDLVGDPRYHAYPAAELAGPKRMIPMPGGRGARWLIRCPKCGAWRKELFIIAGSELRWCRRCLGLRYPSQYTRRRAEASPERLDELLDAALRARSADVAERRMDRLEAAYATWQARELAHQRRVLADVDRFITACERDLANERSAEACIPHKNAVQSPSR